MEQFRVAMTHGFGSRQFRLRIDSCQLAAAVLLCVAAGRAGQNERLMATWELKSVAEHAPSALNIRSWRISFARDGKWNYTG